MAKMVNIVITTLLVKVEEHQNIARLINQSLISRRVSPRHPPQAFLLGLVLCQRFKDKHVGNRIGKFTMHHATARTFWRLNNDFKKSICQPWFKNFLLRIRWYQIYKMVLFFLQNAKMQYINKILTKQQQLSIFYWQFTIYAAFCMSIC